MSSRRTHSPMNTQKSDDTKKRLASQSPASSRSASRAASPASSLGQEPSKEAGWKKGLGFDPAKPADHGQDRGNTRMELPADAYVSDTKKSLFAQRGSKLNTEGKTDVIEVNQYRMTNFDFSKKIFQYDVRCLSFNILLRYFLTRVLINRLLYLPSLPRKLPS